MHRIKHLAIPAFLVLAVALLAPAVAQADWDAYRETPGKAATGKTSARIAKAVGAKAGPIGTVKPGRPGITPDRSLKTHEFEWPTYAAANHRCGEWYRWFLAFGSPYYGCTEIVLEFARWVPGWTGSMMELGWRWTNGGYVAGHGPYRCRRGWIAFKASDGVVHVWDSAAYPEKCGWGYW